MHFLFNQTFVPSSFDISSLPLLGTIDSEGSTSSTCPNGAVCHVQCLPSGITDPHHLTTNTHRRPLSSPEPHIFAPTPVPKSIHQRCVVSTRGSVMNAQSTGGGSAAAAVPSDSAPLPCDVTAGVGGLSELVIRRCTIKSISRQSGAAGNRSSLGDSPPRPTRTLTDATDERQRWQN